jgi:hypothetical protein
MVIKLSIKGVFFMLEAERSALHERAQEKRRENLKKKKSVQICFYFSIH